VATLSDAKASGSHSQRPSATRSGEGAAGWDGGDA
jgi:hypothetical protein